MKNIIALALLVGVTSSPAAIVTFDLSPAGTDNAVGLSPLNEVPPVTNSVGTGNEINSGISVNTDTLELTLSIGYGSAFGFADLTGPATTADIDGPAGTNASAPAIIDLSALNSAATNPVTGGSIVGTVTLSTNELADLLAGLYYVNIGTATNPLGEIRGQLVPVDTLPTLVCAASTNLECTGDGTLVSLTAQISDQDGDALTAIWSVNGVALQTNSVAAGDSTNATSITFDALYEVGTNVVTISVSDGVENPVTCTATVTVVDTTPPTIESASVTPNVLWPPNHKMIPVRVSITATDLCGSVTSEIISITSNQGVLAKGSGHTPIDWKITGPLTAKVRAERVGKDKNGRTYTLVIQSTDQSGNAATTNLTVFVPHDKGQRNGNSNAGGNGNGNGGNGNNGNGNGNGNGHGNGHGNGNGKGHNK